MQRLVKIKRSKRLNIEKIIEQNIPQIIKLNQAIIT